MYQFEARFVDAENCCGFEYVVKGFKKQTGIGYASKPTSLPSTEEININTKMYQAAKKILGTLNSSISDTTESIQLVTSKKNIAVQETLALPKEISARDIPNN